MLYILGLSELNLAQPSILILKFLFCRLHVESSGSPCGVLQESVWTPLGVQPLPHQKKEFMWSPCGVHQNSMGEGKVHV